MHPLMVTVIVLVSLLVLRKVGQLVFADALDERARKIEKLVTNLEIFSGRRSRLNDCDHNRILAEQTNEIRRQLGKYLGVELELISDIFCGDEEPPPDDRDRFGSQGPPGRPPTVDICRVPGGDLKDEHTISVSQEMVHSYLSEGGMLGPCPPPPDLTPEEADEKLAIRRLPAG